MDISNLLDGTKNIAVIGASNDPEKYGFRIYRDLKQKSFEVFPVNNKSDIIQGDKAYKTIFDIPKKVEILDFVVPPAVSLEIAMEAYKKGFRIFWFQPGASDDDVISRLKDLKDIVLIYDMCIMIQSDHKH